MRRPVLLGVAACLLIAVGLLPVEESDQDPGLRRSNPEWRVNFQIGSAQWYLYLLELRDSVMASLGETVSPVEIRIDSAVTERARPAIRAALGARFDYLAPDPAMRTVVLVVPGSAPGTPWGYFGTAQLVPTTTDGRTCIAVTGFGSWDLRRFQQGHGLSPYSLSRIRERGLGACGFYAAFGLPGRHVASWLEHHNYAPVQDLDWVSDPLASPEPVGRGDHDEVRFSVDLAFVGCAAGDLARCRGAIYGDPDQGRLPVAWADFRPAGVASTRAFGGPGGSRHPLGPWTGSYFGDMIGHFGRETFRRFWTSDDSLHAAFAAATGEDLDEWTMRWARSYIGTPASGNRIPLGSAVSAVVLMGVLVATAAGFALRRQVV
jgi:hypothetical protein